MAREVDPFLDAGMRGFIVNTARRNFWKIASWYDLDDLIQDGMVCYYRCYRRYRFLTVRRHPSQNDKRHFQSLVGRAFENHIISLAWKRSRLPEVTAASITGLEDETSSVWENLCPPQDEEATLSILLRQAPKEIKMLLDLLVNDAADGFWRVPGRKWVQRRRETTNEHFCRRLGLDPSKLDLVTKLEQYFLQT